MKTSKSCPKLSAFHLKPHNLHDPWWPDPPDQNRDNPCAVPRLANVKVQIALQTAQSGWISQRVPIVAALLLQPASTKPFRKRIKDWTWTNREQLQLWRSARDLTVGGALLDPRLYVMLNKRPFSECSLATRAKGHTKPTKREGGVRFSLLWLWSWAFKSLKSFVLFT